MQYTFHHLYNNEDPYGDALNQDNWDLQAEQRERIFRLRGYEAILDEIQYDIESNKRRIKRLHY